MGVPSEGVYVRSNILLCCTGPHGDLYNTNTIFPFRTPSLCPKKSNLPFLQIENHLLRYYEWSDFCLQYVSTCLGLL